MRVRIAFNQDEPEPEERPFFPAPPQTEPSILETLGVPLRPIPGWRDLMHHKYAVRDGRAVWTGSMNWTVDAWTRQENVTATLESAPVAAAYARNFAQLWDAARVGASGDFDTPPADGVRPWFCPGRGPELSHRIAKRIGAARRRVRIASPAAHRRARSWARSPRSWARSASTWPACATPPRSRRSSTSGTANPRSRWKAPLLERCLAAFTGKRSTPYAPGAVHDYMHAKLTVADDVVFLGSFNLSRSGETNAENVLEIADAALADELAAYVDALRARYPEPRQPSRLSSAALGGVSDSQATAWPSPADLSTFSESRAHFMRVAEMSIPSRSSTKSRSRRRRSSTGMPMTSSEAIEADAWEIAQPWPEKRTAATRPSSSSLSWTFSSSPQSGLLSSNSRSASGSSGWGGPQLWGCL